MTAEVKISDQVLVRHLQGETVLLDLRSQRYFGLDEVGTRIWQLAKETDDLNAIYQTLLAEYDVAENRLQQDLGNLLSSAVGTDVASMRLILGLLVLMRSIRGMLMTVLLVTFSIIACFCSGVNSNRM